jgi:hypothetical protein
LAKPKVKSPNYSQLGIKAFCHQNSSLPLPLAASLLLFSSKWTLLLLPPTFPSQLVVQASQPDLHKLLPVVFILNNNSLCLQNTSMTSS